MRPEFVCMGFVEIFDLQTTLKFMLFVKSYIAHLYAIYELRLNVPLLRNKYQPTFLSNPG